MVAAMTPKLRAAIRGLFRRGLGSSTPGKLVLCLAHLSTYRPYY